MPEITKSGAKLHLFIVTHKYTDLYFIFSFNNQPQVGKPTWGYDYTTVLRRLPHHIVRHHHLIAPTAQYTTIGGKTAEERFNMLARGWLAYPVTPTHHPSTAEERLYTSTHGRFALSRRRATALFRNPVCKAQRSVPGFSSAPTSACRRYATSPSFGGCLTPSSAIHRIAPSAQYTAIGVTPSARSDSRGRIGHRLAPSICASGMRSYADRASGHAFS